MPDAPPQRIICPPELLPADGLKLQGLEHAVDFLQAEGLLDGR